MPVDDWQFWVVTLIALIAGLLIVRATLPERLRPFRRRGRGKSATLTIKGKARGRA
ncbi:MAG: hypothetical protein KF864_06135 [Phycisphaeraceae bacterium]|nr:hypothetical protein [Phycisphaeraceae bacterium]MBX3410505.1 hypothetical protein [Phycisphaeraceae bacterium]